MSDTILYVHSHAPRDEQVQWSFPYYQLSGWPIVGVVPENQAHEFPEGALTLKYGKSGYVDTPHIIERLLFTLEHFLTQPQEYCAIIEYDGLFLRKPPVMPPYQYASPHTVGPMPYAGLKSKFGGYGQPWMMNKETAKNVIQVGKGLLSVGDIERGSPDMFIGYVIVDKLGIKWTPINTFHVNGGALTERMKEAEHAVRNGAWFVHGFRTQEELEHLKGLL